MFCLSRLYQQGNKPHGLRCHALNLLALGLSCLAQVVLQLHAGPSVQGWCRKRRQGGIAGGLCDYLRPRQSGLGLGVAVSRSSRRSGGSDRVE